MNYTTDFNTIELRSVNSYVDSLFVAHENKKIIPCDQINQMFHSLLTLHSSVMKGHFCDKTLSTRTIILRTISEGRFWSRKHNLGDIFTRTIRLKDIKKDISERTFLTVTPFTANLHTYLLR